MMYSFWKYLGQHGIYIALDCVTLHFCTESHSIVSAVRIVVYGSVLYCNVHNVG